LIEKQGGQQQSPLIIGAWWRYSMGGGLVPNGRNLKEAAVQVLSPEQK